MRYTLFLVLICFGIAPSLAQTDFGVLTNEEKNFQIFENDTTASAVYLFEKGNNYFDVRHNYIYLITEYHAKIKILKKEGFDVAEIKLPYYHTEKSTEKILEVKAITHNNGVKTFVQPQNIFTTDDDENWSHKVFTFPDIRVGSILEYSYEVQSPFHFNLSGWNFQSEIPKVYSEYNARIPGNWVYNRSLIGEIPLDKAEATVKKDCFYIPGYGVADCEILKYVMKDIPAFEASEKFMLAPRNYRSKLEFELSEYHSLRGYTEKFTKTWKYVDKEFRSDKDIGRQLRKKNFFENNIPPDLLVGDEAPLDKAKRIYAFVKQHFNWNNKFGVWHDNNVKKAFEARKGNVAEINIALINLLNSVGLEVNMMLLATRNRGLPKRTHPVMTDFNYIVAKLDIDGKSYLLDASDKRMPFGMLPYRCLNYFGRVMDFQNDSYWYDIVPDKKNKKQIRAQMELDIESGVASGKFNVVNTGYEAVAEWQSLKSQPEEDYLTEKEEDIDQDFYITSHKVFEDKSTDKLLMQQFGFEIENVVQEGTIYLNPNIVKFFPTNPFLAPERHYPIDFGYHRSYEFNLNLKIPEGYRVKSIPDNKRIALPENLGLLRFECLSSNEKSVSVLFSLKLNASHYNSDMYAGVQEIFKQAVEAQTNNYIVLEKR